MTIVVSKELNQSVVTGYYCTVVDAQQGGCGNLEIVINDGQVPCTVRQTSVDRFHASFLPQDDSVHYVDILFNGSRLVG